MLSARNSEYDCSFFPPLSFCSKTDMETYAGAYPAVLAGGGRSILYGKRDACLARIWLVADADGGWHLFSIYGCKVDAADDTT